MSNAFRNKPFVYRISATLVAITIAGSPFGFAQKSTVRSSGDLEKQLKNDEQALVDAERRHDSSAFGWLLRDDLIYVAFNGWVFTKKDLISKMQYVDVEEYDP